MEVDEDSGSGDLTSGSSTSLTSKDFRFLNVKRRLKYQIRRRKKKRFSVKCRDISTKLNISHNRSLIRSASPANTPSRALLRTLRAQNASLAAALNDKMVEIRDLGEVVDGLNAEILGLKVELADLRAAREDEANAPGITPEALEAEFQVRLVEYLEPVKTVMNKMLDHTVGLTDEITRAMHMVSAPGRRSRSVASLASTSSGVSLARRATLGKKTSGERPFISSPAGKDGSGRSPTVAHVSPRVGGHAIHKPNIEIQRLGADEITRYQEAQRRRRLEQEQREAEENADEDEEGENEEEEEEEPLERSNVSANQMEAEEDDGLEDEEDENDLIQPQQRRTASGRLSTIGEDDEEEEDEMEVEESVREEIVLTTPRRSRSRSRRGSANSLARSLSNSLQGAGSPVVLLQDVSGLLSQYNLLHETDEEEEEAANEEDVEDASPSASGMTLLVPRLVLSKVKIKPDKKKRPTKSPSPRKSVVRNLNLSPSPVKNLQQKRVSSRANKPKRSYAEVSDEENPNEKTPTPEDGENRAPIRRKTYAVSQSSQSEELPAEFFQTFNKNFKAVSEPNRVSERKSRSAGREDPEPSIPVEPSVPDAASMDESVNVVENEVARQSLDSADETPKGRESIEEFTQRMCNHDPLEGPSWLFTEDNKVRPGRRSREILERKKRSSLTLRAQIGECSKKLNMSSEDDDDDFAPVEPKPKKKGKRKMGKAAAAPAIKKSRKGARKTVTWKQPSVGGSDAEDKEVGETVAEGPAKIPEETPVDDNMRSSSISDKPDLDQSLASEDGDHALTTKRRRRTSSLVSNETPIAETEAERAEETQNKPKGRGRPATVTSTPKESSSEVKTRGRPPSIETPLGEVKPKGRSSAKNSPAPATLMGDEPAPSDPAGKAKKSRTSSMASSVGSTSMEESALDESGAGGGRPKRRAATNANYKEPKANQKMRQGDSGSSSIYKDFIPGVKDKKAPSRRSGAKK